MDTTPKDQNKGPRVKEFKELIRSHARQSEEMGKKRWPKDMNGIISSISQRTSALSIKTQDIEAL
jgi:hypothetical protein